MKPEDKFTDADWQWVVGRLPRSPQSVRVLVLDAMAAGWCCWDVTGNRVTLRNFQHRERTGIVYEVDLIWSSTGTRPRFTRADLTELRDLGTSRTLGDAAEWLK